MSRVRNSDLRAAGEPAGEEVEEVLERRAAVVVEVGGAARGGGGAVAIGIVTRDEEGEVVVDVGPLGVAGADGVAGVEADQALAVAVCVVAEVRTLGLAEGVLDVDRDPVLVTAGEDEVEVM